MKRLLKIAGGLVVVALFAVGGLYGAELLFSGGSRASEDSRGSGGGDDPTRVSTAAVESALIEDRVTAVGSLMPLRQVELRPAVEGRVVEVAVSSGDEVAQGDLILRLDSRAEEATVAEAEATLREAQQNFDRVEELSRTNNAAQDQLEAARARLTRAEAGAEGARAALEDRRLTAPFDGSLGLIDTDPGEYVDTATTVAELSDLSVVQADLALPERYFERLEPGLGVEVETPAYPGETFTGTVTVRAPLVSPNSRSFDIRAEIDNADRRLVGGMFAQSRIVFGDYEGLAVPDDAVISEGLTSYVFTVDEDTARRQEVRLGGSVGSLTEVAEGLEEGARVVVAGWDTLSDGAPVTVSDDVSQEALE